MGHQDITPGGAVVEDFEVLGLCRGNLSLTLGMSVKLVTGGFYL